MRLSAHPAEIDISTTKDIRKKTNRKLLMTIEIEKDEFSAFSGIQTNGHFLNGRTGKFENVATEGKYAVVFCQGLAEKGNFYRNLNAYLRSIIENFAICLFGHNRCSNRVGSGYSI